VNLDDLPQESREMLLQSTRELVRTSQGRQVLFYILALTHQYKSSHDGDAAA